MLFMYLQYSIYYSRYRNQILHINRSGQGLQITILQFCSILYRLTAKPLGKSSRWELPVEMVGNALSLVFDRFEKLKKLELSTR